MVCSIHIGSSKCPLRQGVPLGHGKYNMHSSAKQETPGKQVQHPLPSVSPSKKQLATGKYGIHVPLARIQATHPTPTSPQRGREAQTAGGGEAGAGWRSWCFATLRTARTNPARRCACGVYPPNTNQPPTWQGVTAPRGGWAAVPTWGGRGGPGGAGCLRSVSQVLSCPTACALSPTPTSPQRHAGTNGQWTPDSLTACRHQRVMDPRWTACPSCDPPTHDAQPPPHNLHPAAKQEAAKQGVH